MTNQGEHKRDKPLLIYWIITGFGIGIAIGASTHEWALSLISGTLMGVCMGFAATKSGVDNR